MTKAIEAQSHAAGGGDLLKDGDSITETESPTDIMDLVSKYAFGDVEEK